MLQVAKPVGFRPTTRRMLLKAPNSRRSRISRPAAFIRPASSRMKSSNCSQSRARATPRRLPLLGTQASTSTSKPEGRSTRAISSTAVLPSGMALKAKVRTTASKLLAANGSAGAFACTRHAGKLRCRGDAAPGTASPSTDPFQPRHESARPSRASSTPGPGPISSTSG